MVGEDHEIDARWKLQGFGVYGCRCFEGLGTSYKLILPIGLVPVSLNIFEHFALE